MATEAQQGESSQACYYLDALQMSLALRGSLQWLQRDLQMAEVGVGGQSADQQEQVIDLKRSRARRLEHLLSETPDMLAFLQSDGTLVIQAVANVDRRPPTLCQSFIVLKMAANVSLDPSHVAGISFTALSTSAASHCYTPTGLLHIMLRNGDLVKFHVTPSLLFDGLGQGLAKIDACHALHAADTCKTAHNHRIAMLAVIPSIGVCTVSESGEIIKWGRTPSRDGQQGHMQAKRLQVHGKPSVVAAHRDLLAWYSSSNECYLSSYSNGCATNFRLAGLPAIAGVEMLMVQQSAQWILIVAAGSSLADVYVWQVERARLHIGGVLNASIAGLPSYDSKLRRVFAVSSKDEVDDDSQLALGTLSSSGMLIFWSLTGWGHGTPSLVEASRIATGCTQITAISCSADGLVAVACKSSGGQASNSVRVYDSRSSFISMAPEADILMDDDVVGLAWSPCSLTGPVVLALATPTSFEVLCRRRLSYMDRLRPRQDSPRWEVIAQVQLANLTAGVIEDLAWLSDCSILVATSNMLLSYSGLLHSPTLDVETAPRHRHLLTLAAERTSPLADWDPEVLLQCLVWGWTGVARQILANLASAVDAMIPSEALQVEALQWGRAESIEREWRDQSTQVRETNLIASHTSLTCRRTMTVKPSGSVQRWWQFQSRRRQSGCTCTDPAAGQAAR